MIRFAEGAAHPARGHTPEGVPRLGEEFYSFVPSSKRVRVEDVPRFLSELSAPAFLLPTTTRGIVSMHLVDELSSVRAQSMEHEFENQIDGLNKLVTQYGIADDARVLLEFGDETHVTTIDVLKTWSKRFAVNVGWSISQLAGDPRASVRLNLFRSDGVNSVGNSTTQTIG
jgi:hypothetical protein